MTIRSLLDKLLQVYSAEITKRPAIRRSFVVRIHNAGINDFCVIKPETDNIILEGMSEKNSIWSHNPGQHSRHDFLESISTNFKPSWENRRRESTWQI